MFFPLSNSKVKLVGSWSEMEAEPKMVGSRKHQQSVSDLLIDFTFELFHEINDFNSCLCAKF